MSGADQVVPGGIKYQDPLSGLDDPIQVFEHRYLQVLVDMVEAVSHQGRVASPAFEGQLSHISQDVLARCT